VEGVRELQGVYHRVIPDRIEAATLLLAAAITRGQATINRVIPEHLRAVLAALAEAGAALEIGPEGIAIDAQRPLRPVNLVAEPYPGVPTDVQAQWTALMAVAAGRSRIRDRVFPGRFLHVAELRRLGARIRVAGGGVVVNGTSRLQGARIRASDLRASAALVLAGLAAEGRTTIEAAEHLDRGYERLDAKLFSLGARIVRDDDGRGNSEGGSGKEEGLIS
jgi:UDP-N-acetylglucosamine 1-carboxyvinyltransferase